MHVIFTSNCIARAKSRTRKVLDSYALRISNDTWSTPITHEILKVIYKALKAKATKIHLFRVL